jgi:Domain of unknown function (DUF4157)
MTRSLQRQSSGVNAAIFAMAGANGVLQRKCDCGQHTGGGECEECKKKKVGLQRHANGSAGPTIAPPVVHEVLQSPGQPLETGTRQSMERRFGHDFSAVRLHADRKSQESAGAVRALAYTVGNHIVFGANQYAPRAEASQRLLAHELTHTLQQRRGSFSSLAIVDSDQHEREAENAAAGIFSRRPSASLNSAAEGSVFRQKADAGSPPAVDRTLPKDAPAQKHKEPEKQEKCEEFPGGSTDCALDKTGTPTGKVTHHIDEKNPCTKPCVEEHEAVHVKQLKTFCPELRDCYLASDKGKRPAEDCAKMAMFGAKRECEAYKVSLPCVEKRLKKAPECQTKHKEYGTRKLASEKCFENKNCAGAGAK